MSAHPYPLAATNAGRILLALRAGTRDSSQLTDTFGENRLNHGLTDLRALERKIGKQLMTVRKADNLVYYTLTAEGRAMCPEWRSLMGWVPPECRAVATESELMETR